MSKKKFYRYHKIIVFIKKYEVLLSLSLFFIPYLLLFQFIQASWWIKFLLLGTSWFGVLLFSDYINTRVNKDTIISSRKLITNRLAILGVAALLMNIFSDLTGSFLTRLWYYPNISPVVYVTLFAPLGYVLFGLILYIFYHIFKGLLNKKVKKGRTKKRDQKLYKVVMKIYPVLALILSYVSLDYFYNLSQLFPIKFWEINMTSSVTVDFFSTFSIWLGLFMILEFACYKQNKETLTRDIIRHNYIPLLSILLSSLTIIILVEWFNTPFQIWVFDNWAGSEILLFEIPLLAYLIWPIQYLVLLPLVRLLDKSNRENVW